MTRAKKNPTTYQEMYGCFERGRVQKSTTDDLHLPGAWYAFRPREVRLKRFPTWREALAYALNEGEEK